jgi:thiamine biosynthesis lipoprotein
VSFRRLSPTFPPPFPPRPEWATFSSMQPARMAWIALVLLALGLILLMLINRSSLKLRPPSLGKPAEVRYHIYREEMMGTEIQVVLPERAKTHEDAETVFSEFRRVDERMSEWKETSPLSAVNRAAGGGGAPVPEDLRHVVRRGLEIGDLTGGAFDITWAALWGLWDFKTEAPGLPDPAEVARRAALVDYRQVEVDDEAGTVRLPRPGMKLGLGGIAKGYALERGADVLRQAGYESFMLLGGGQVLVAGERNGRPWRVGIRDPRGAPDDFFAALDVIDVSVSTSGDYESYFILGGKRYHHIIDPRTGMPSTGLRSVTVVSSDPTLADALSTAIMVMGKEEGLALVKSLDGTEAVLVDDEGAVEVTAGLESRLTIHRSPRP